MCSELRHHALVTSEFILNEFREKLTGRFKFTSEEGDTAVALLLTRMVVVDPTGFSSAICRDPDGDDVLATAAAGNCDCIITGDKGLLVLQRFSGVDIVSPGDFLEYEATH